jgi:membrane-bound lytic murein transglycosylase B
VACGAGWLVVLALTVGVSAVAAAPSAAPRLPRDPARLAAAFATATRSLHALIDRWQASGHLAERRPPHAVEAAARSYERIELLLVRDEALARRTIARLPSRLADEASDEVTARRELSRLTPPRPLREFRVGRPLPAGVLLGYYREAQRRFGVAWQVLAAVNLVESAFDKIRNTSVAGAQGPMQFVAASWQRYGLGGDVHDPHDAILGAANYLHAAGAPHDYHRALFAYNPSGAYVDAVLRYARQLTRDPRTFLVYYAWPVFVRTPQGVRCVTC